MNFETILIYVIFLIIVVLVAVIVTAVETKNREKYKMSFMESFNLTGLPIVTFKNSDVNFNFLLDTGSSNSVINSKAISNIKYEDLKVEGTIFGMEGITKRVKYVRVNLEYKNLILSEDFQSVDMQGAFDEVKKSTGVSIVGILGSSFLQRNKYVLDFKDLIAYTKK